MRIHEALDMIYRRETQEQYEQRIVKLRRLVNERETLEDAVDVLGDDPRSVNKRKRLQVVYEEIRKLS